MSPTARLCVSGMAPQNLVGTQKSSWRVCSPRKWRETTVFKKTCAPASPAPKYWPEWCPTSRSLRAHPCYMKFVEIERNFLDLKTGSSRVLRGTKCPKKIPRRAPYGPIIGGNLVKCPLLQGYAYPRWRPEIWLGPENQPGVRDIAHEMA